MAIVLEHIDASHINRHVKQLSTVGSLRFLTHNTADNEILWSPVYQICPCKSVRRTQTLEFSAHTLLIHDGKCARRVEGSEPQRILAR